MDTYGNPVGAELRAALNRAVEAAEANPSPEAVAKVRELHDRHHEHLVDHCVELGRRLRGTGSMEGAVELRSAMHRHAAEGGDPAAETLERLAADDPWWSEG